MNKESFNNLSKDLQEELLGIAISYHENNKISSTLNFMRIMGLPKTPQSLPKVTLQLEQMVKMLNTQ